MWHISHTLQLFAAGSRRCTIAASCRAKMLSIPIRISTLAIPAPFGSNFSKLEETTVSRIIYSERGLYSIHDRVATSVSIVLFLPRALG